VRETAQIADAGAQEVDVVLPFTRLIAGDEGSVAALLAAVRAACTGLTLKVILETGVLADAALIARAATLSLQHGADFLKTSTGRTPVSATPDAARVMLGVIAADAQAAPRVGFKASGGIRTVADAAVYIALCRDMLGAQALSPRRFRIGASSLLADIEAVLDGHIAVPAMKPAGPGSY
jgi:deoxyribose-phosphate aldolase